MVTLTQGSQAVENVFQLLGSNEDAITAAIAWTMLSSPRLLSSFLSQCAGYKGNVDDAQLFFQRHERDRGRTDLEIIIPGALHVILEAKKGWELPGPTQLELYTRRKLFAASSAPIRLIVTLSQADQRFASLYLPPSVNGVDVKHLSRQDLFRVVSGARSATARIHEKKHLSQLAEFLNQTMSKPNVQSNLVYVVSLSRKGLWPGTSFIDVVEKHGKYFHPVGGPGRWPTVPPNYIGFRYDGELKSIHHIEDAVVTKDLADTVPGKLAACPQPNYHFIYTLGPAIRPLPRPPNGPKVTRSMRRWAALDALLTAKTISDAITETKARLVDAP